MFGPLLNRKHNLNDPINNLDKWFLCILVSIKDRDRYLEIAATYLDNAIYLTCFQDSIQLFLLGLKTVL